MALKLPNLGEGQMYSFKMNPKEDKFKQTHAQTIINCRKTRTNNVKAVRGKRYTV